MARYWKRGADASASVSTGTVQNVEVYHNDSSLDTQDTPFDVVVVAQFLTGISSEDDLVALKVFTAQESVTPDTNFPADETDRELRGYYHFGKGPVYFQSRGKIVVPPQHKLWIQYEKVTGSNTPTIHVGYNFLLVTKDA